LLHPIDEDLQAFICPFITLNGDRRVAEPGRIMAEFPSNSMAIYADSPRGKIFILLIQNKLIK